MKNITPAMKEHLAGEVTTLATCWRATLTNGAIYGFTDHSRDIEFEGTTFLYATGFTPTAVETTSMLNVDNLDVEAILDSSLIKEEDLMAGLWDFAKVEVFWVNWNDLSMGKVDLKTGTIGEVTLKRTSFVAEVRGLTQPYQNNIVEITSPMCRARLGDNRCKIDLIPLTTTSAVETADSSRRIFTDPNLTAPGPAVSVAIIDVSRAEEAVLTTDVEHGFINGQQIFISGVQGVVQLGSVDQNGVMQPGTGDGINGYTYGISNVTTTTFTIPVDTRLGSNNEVNGPAYSDVYSAYAGGGVAAPSGQSAYYDYGLVTFKTGLNAGLSMEVKSYVPGLIELQLPMPYPILPNDEYEIQPGCGKRLIDDCKNKFNNVINFRGEPYLPGMDRATTYASHGSAIADGTAVDIGGTGGGTGGGGTGGGGTGGGGTGGGTTIEPTKQITAIDTGLGDVWYFSNVPSETGTFTMDPSKGVLSHITVRKIFTVPNHGYVVGDYIVIDHIPALSGPTPKKEWTANGKDYVFPFQDAAPTSLSGVLLDDYVFFHRIARVTQDTFELWSNYSPTSQQDLDGYMAMPSTWAQAYQGGGTAKRDNVVNAATYNYTYSYPRSYQGQTYDGTPSVPMVDPRTGWVVSTVPGEGWIPQTGGAWRPYTLDITAIQIEMGDVWYATGNPSSPWSTDPAAGTLSHITVRKIFTCPGHTYPVGRVIDTMGIHEHSKVWTSPLGVQKTLTIHEIGIQLVGWSERETWEYTHNVRRVTASTFEFWDVIPLASQDDLDAYLNMPVGWTTDSGYPLGVNGNRGFAWVDVGTWYDEQTIQYPMSYAGTVVNSGKEVVQYPLSGALLLDPYATTDTFYGDPLLNTPDSATTVAITSIVPENGMARVTAPGHTFQNGDAVKIKDVIGIILYQFEGSLSGGDWLFFNRLTWLVSGVTANSFLINFDASHGFDTANGKYAYYTAYSHGGTAARVTGRTRHLITDWHVECDSSVLYGFLQTYPNLVQSTDTSAARTLVYKCVFTAPGHGLVTGDMPWMAGDGNQNAMDGFSVGGMDLGQRPYNAPLDSSWPFLNKFYGQLVTEYTANTFTVHKYITVYSQAEADALVASLVAKGTGYTGNVYVTKGMKMSYRNY